MTRRNNPSPAPEKSADIDEGAPEAPLLRTDQTPDRPDAAVTTPRSEVDEAQARFGQLIADAAPKTNEDKKAEKNSTPDDAGKPQLPTVGRMVHYHSKNGDDIVSPAVVLRTRQSTNLDVIERWGNKPDGTLSGTSRPEELVAELPDDTTVDLVVHGLGGDYREYAIPMASTDEAELPAPGTWSWPPRV